MALDPTIAPIVDAVNAAAAKAPPLADQTVAERRAAYHKLVSMAGPGPEVGSVTDRDIGVDSGVDETGDGATVPVRIYQPQAGDDNDENRAGIGICVFYHGGGFVIGDLDTHDEVCRQLCVQSGAVVVSVDYRLGPEHRFPAAIDDAWIALRWVDANRETLTADATAPVSACGDSAGGTVAAVMAIMARDHDLPLAAQLLVYPGVMVNRERYRSMVDNGEGYVLTRASIDWFQEQYLGPGGDLGDGGLGEDGLAEDGLGEDWRASPLLAPSHERLAPALIITAEYDPIRDEGIEYADTLRAAGVDVTHTNYEGMAHIFFQLGPIVPKGADAVTQVAGAIPIGSRP